jgi:hypothetical protein
MTRSCSDHAASLFRSESLGAPVPLTGKAARAAFGQFTSTQVR